ncbi:MAG: nitroreductase [Lachnospiraceae bacterium]|jgi:nitroreductase|nr:nitroreductase [Lachnospiraceae bacterium]
MKKEVLEALTERRSIRNYRPDPIGQEELDEIVKAGLYAPSGMGKQSSKFVVITDRETRDLLSKMNGRIMGIDRDPFYGAPVVIVVLGDPAVGTYVYDGALAIGNMLNAAYALGIGSCWVHRAKEEFESEEGRALLEKWGVSGNLEGIGHVILGRTEELSPAAAPRKEGRVFKV